jgi:hypothetical protein
MPSEGIMVVQSKNLQSRFVQQPQTKTKDKILIVTSNQIILEEGK